MEPRVSQLQAVARGGGWSRHQQSSCDSEKEETRQVVLTSAAGRAEQEGGRGALVTVPAHHVRSTATLTAAGLAHSAE